MGKYSDEASNFGSRMDRFNRKLDDGITYLDSILEKIGIDIEGLEVDSLAYHTSNSVTRLKLDIERLKNDNNTDKSNVSSYANTLDNQEE